MALSTCPKCDNHTFEMQIAEPKNSTFKFSFIQCSTCGAVIGFTEFNNVSVQLAKQNEAIKKMAQALKVNVDL